MKMNPSTAAYLETEGKGKFIIKGNNVIFILHARPNANYVWAAKTNKEALRNLRNFRAAIKYIERPAECDQYA